MNQFLNIFPEKQKIKPSIIEVYQRISLTQYFPEYNLKKGNIAMLIDTATHLKEGENSYVLEVVGWANLKYYR